MSAEDVPVQEDAYPQGGVVFAGASPLSGFTIVPNAVLLNPLLSAPAKTLYAVLRSFAWEYRATVWPGQEKLCEMLGFTDKTLRKYLLELEESGLVEIRHRARGHNNLYIVHEPSSTGGGSDEPEPETFRVANRNISGRRIRSEEDEGSQTSSSSSNPPSKGSPPRPRNLVWDELAVLVGEPSTPSETKDFAKTVHEISDAMRAEGVNLSEAPEVRAQLQQRWFAMQEGYRSHRSLRNRWGELGAIRLERAVEQVMDERELEPPCSWCKGNKLYEGSECGFCHGTGVEPF